jgi:hypothetical protein
MNLESITESRKNSINGPQPYLSQNNFNDWLKNPDLVRVWHHDRKNMPKPSPELQALFDFGHAMHRKAHELYPNGFEDTCKLSYPEHLENSKLLLTRRIPLFELGFQVDNLYARPDIMVPVGECEFSRKEAQKAQKEGEQGSANVGAGAARRTSSAGAGESEFSHKEAQKVQKEGEQGSVPGNTEPQLGIPSVPPSSCSADLLSAVKDIGRCRAGARRSKDMASHSDIDELCDISHKAPAWDLIEVKAAPAVYEDFVKYVAFLYYVIVRADVKINRCYLMHLKKGIYARPEMLAEDIFEMIDVTDRVLALQGFVQQGISSMRGIVQQYAKSKLVA